MFLWKASGASTLSLTQSLPLVLCERKTSQQHVWDAPRKGLRWGCCLLQWWRPGLGAEKEAEEAASRGPHIDTGSGAVFWGHWRGALSRHLTFSLTVPQSVLEWKDKALFLCANSFKWFFKKKSQIHSDWTIQWHSLLSRCRKLFQF